MDGDQESELPAHQQVTAGRDAYVAEGDVHVRRAPSAATARDESGLGFVNSAGVQIGSGNVQVNNFYAGSTKSDAEDSRIMSSLPVSGVVSSSQLLVATESLRGHSLRIWDAVTGAKKATIRDHRDALEATALSPDGTLLATGSYGRTARIRDAATGATRATLTGYRGIVWRVAFSQDGTLLATLSTGESSVRIWDSSTGAARATLTGSGDPAQDVAFSPDSTLLATAVDSTVQVRDIATGALRASLRGHTSGIMALAFSPDGTLVATGSFDETARIWEAATGAVRAILIGHRGSARRVAFSPDGTLLATMDDRCMLRIWDARVGTLRATRTGPIWGAALAPYGKLRTFRYEAASILATVKHESDGMAFSPDGVLFAAFGNGNALQIWDAGTGARRITLETRRGLLRAAAFTAANP
jgi:WD40 repeat protein